jgi:hypothetical protein
MELLRFLAERALESVDAFFLVESDGEQDGFHRIVVALIGSRLGVAAGAMEEAVEKRLVFAAQGAAEFGPARGGVVDQLNECRNGAAHGSFPSAKIKETNAPACPSVPPLGAPQGKKAAATKKNANRKIK